MKHVKQLEEAEDDIRDRNMREVRSKQDNERRSLQEMQKEQLELVTPLLMHQLVRMGLKKFRLE